MAAVAATAATATPPTAPPPRAAASLTQPADAAHGLASQVLAGVRDDFDEGTSYFAVLEEAFAGGARRKNKHLSNFYITCPR